MDLLVWLCSRDAFKFQLSKINGIFDVSLSIVPFAKESKRRKRIIEISLQIFDRLSNDFKTKYIENRKKLYELLADNEYNFILCGESNNAYISHYNHIVMSNIVRWYKLAGNDSKSAKAEKELLKIKGTLVIPSIPVEIYTPEEKRS